MKIQPLRNPASRSKGITLIEILMVLGLLVILLSFAMPSISGPAIRAEMTATLENVEYSIQAARNMARMTESSVSLNVLSNQEEAVQTISYSSATSNRAGGNAGMQDYRLPTDIVLVSDQDSFAFDERGLVENPGQIILVSRVDESVRSVIEVK